jgi:hypothetical protein
MAALLKGTLSDGVFSSPKKSLLIKLFFCTVIITLRTIYGVCVCVINVHLIRVVYFTVGWLGRKNGQPITGLVNSKLVCVALLSARRRVFTEFRPHGIPNFFYFHVFCIICNAQNSVELYGISCYGIWPNSVEFCGFLVCGLHISNFEGTHM